jgi:hypothetical protein
VKLIWRLMGDKRINFLLKLLPVAAVIYLVSPIDLIPDPVPILGYLDDLVLIPHQNHFDLVMFRSQVSPFDNGSRGKVAAHGIDSNLHRMIPT